MPNPCLLGSLFFAALRSQNQLPRALVDDAGAEEEEDDDVGAEERDCCCSLVEALVDVVAAAGFIPSPERMPFVERSGTDVLSFPSGWARLPGHPFVAEGCVLLLMLLLVAAEAAGFAEPGERRHRFSAADSVQKEA